MDYSDFIFGGISGKDGYAYSSITSFLSEGYVSETINKNITDWLLSAYERNPGIINCIKDHSLTEAYSFSSFIHDGWGMQQNGISSVSVSESAGNFGKSIVWTNHKSGSYTDMDFAFANAGSSLTDWREKSVLWVYADVSGYGNSDVPVGIAFEENDTDSAGKLTSDRETWGLRPGGKAVLIASDGSETRVSIVSSANAINDNKGRVMLPSGFSGWISILIDSDNFISYWNYPQGNGVLDMKNVHQFTLNIEGTPTSSGKSALIGPFMLSSDRSKAPESVNDKAFHMVWRLAPLQNKELGYADNVVFVFYGEFPGKLLTGMSYAYLLSPSDKLKKAGDELTAALFEAQYEDGYLGLFDGEQRFGGSMNWDTWAQYHVLFGLLQWYRATGNTTAYDVMMKSADYIIDFFHERERSYSYGTSMCNLAVAHAFALIYKESGDMKYLTEAESIIENDWKFCGDWLSNIEKGMEFFEMKNNYGNRWEPLHSIMALGEVGRITGNERYLNAFEKLWRSILKTDRRNSGSFSYGEEACGNLFASANGGAVETCCSIAWMALTTDYLTQTLDSKAADEAELSYYNTMLASLTENCREVSYDTPSDGVLIKSQTTLAFQTRDFSPDFCCCQANAARGLCEISKWAILNTDKALYINWYGASEAHITTPSGKPFVFTQKTVYPKNGMISAEVSGLEEPEKFTVNFRVPEWADSFKVTLGEKSYSSEKSGCYFPVTGTWVNGMKIEIEIGMTAHYLVGENDCAGKTSVYYGPVLLALDSNYSDLTLSGSFTAEALSELEICEDDSLLLSVRLADTSGKSTVLISFSDVGRNGSQYASWLNVTGNIEKIDSANGEKAIWCAFAK